MKTQIVISLNDWPQEVLAPGTSLDFAVKRCNDARDAYLKSNPHANPNMVHFHYKEVPVISSGAAVTAKLTKKPARKQARRK